MHMDCEQADNAVCDTVDKVSGRVVLVELVDDPTVSCFDNRIINGAADWARGQPPALAG